MFMFQNKNGSLNRFFKNSIFLHLQTGMSNEPLDHKHEQPSLCYTDRQTILPEGRLSLSSLHYEARLREDFLFSCVICKFHVQLISSCKYSVLSSLWCEIQLRRDPIEQFIIHFLLMPWWYIYCTNICLDIKQFMLWSDFYFATENCWVFREIKHECIQNLSTCVFAD